MNGLAHDAMHHGFFLLLRVWIYGIWYDVDLSVDLCMSRRLVCYVMLCRPCCDDEFSLCHVMFLCDDEFFAVMWLICVCAHIYKKQNLKKYKYIYIIYILNLKLFVFVLIKHVKKRRKNNEKTKKQRKNTKKKHMNLFWFSIIIVRLYVVFVSIKIVI